MFCAPATQDAPDQKSDELRSMLNLLGFRKHLPH